MAALSKDAAFWSKISRKYAADPIRNMEGYLNTLERTKLYLNAKDNVLEIGCGTGSTALLLAAQVAHVTATDLASGMIEIANEKRAEEGLKNVTFKVAEVLEHRLDEGSYDAVLAHNLLHLVPDLDDALAHISSLTKPGGVFISKTVCAPQNGGVKYTMISQIAIPIMQALGKAPFVNFISAEELERKVVDAGFKIVETSDQAGMLPSRYIVARRS
ncbi:class I SAM-dependent methyltransferase [Ruegeria sp. 2205SS24-7]|uniref:class I SAM-dependent methyltransferase n=1 Tax=Ruegeria discodermiae TaxID=3064389 RepID=UPI0027419FD1|nr:class I SAM-dependent methyltransferase [Ruegeria sp. 2205SS24-7]MDP5219842.1 class I SAM-dependent methyltransferase [Ruegeria sp. 2205SS24-7]